MKSLCFREFEALYQDREHVRIAHKAAQEASQRAMNNPRKFCKPSILSALATAMVPSLSVAIRYTVIHVYTHAHTSYMYVHIHTHQLLSRIHNPPCSGLLWLTPLQPVLVVKTSRVWWPVHAPLGNQSQEVLSNSITEKCKRLLGMSVIEVYRFHAFNWS